MNIIRNLTFYGLKNRLYFIDNYDPRTHELHGITIIEYDDKQDIVQKIVALDGRWSDPVWKFTNCQVTTYEDSGNNRSAKVKIYNEKIMDIDEKPEDFLKQRLNVDSMNIKDLDNYISRFAKSGANKAVNNLRVDFHQKIAYPFGNFVIILIGLPFALLIRGRKHSTFTSLGIALLIGFLYYVINALTLAFGKGGLIPPILAAWAAPIIVTGVALIVIEYNF